MIAQRFELATFIRIVAQFFFFLSPNLIGFRMRETGFVFISKGHFKITYSKLPTHSNSLKSFEFSLVWLSFLIRSQT